MSRVWNSTLERYTPIRQRTRLRAVNHERRAAMYEKNFGSYSDLIRQMSCLVCDRSPAEPHHVRSRGAGGDRSDLVPLCAEHHRWYHLRGRESFERVYHVDLTAEAAALWREYGDG